jgi:hypothetical protein
MGFLGVEKFFSSESFGLSTPATKLDESDIVIALKYFWL